MLRVCNKYVLIGSAIALLLCFWNRNDLPGSIAFDPMLENAPRQRKIERPPFVAAFADVDYRVEPEYDYELYGLVVSYRLHDGESMMHRMSNDHLNVADVCVVWSDTAFSEHLDKLDFWNGIFTCNVKTTDRVAWAHFKMNQLSNNHLISDDPFIRKRVDEMRIGDQIRIKGWLSSYGALADGPGDRGKPVAMRGTSTTREDTGDGACETIYVNEFEIVEAAFSRWRFGMYLSLAMLAASLTLYFAMPYRPYRD